MWRAIESKKNIVSNGDIIARKYIEADGAIKASNKIEILKEKGEIFARLKVKNPKKPSIIAKEVTGLTGYGVWETYISRENPKQKEQENFLLLLFKQGEPAIHVLISIFVY